MLKLDLGSGAEEREQHRNGFIGIDFKDYGYNMVRDVTRGLPFSDNTVDEIIAHNFFEHLASEDWMFVLNECWRVLTPEGTIEIIVPPFTHHNAYADPTHKSFWATNTFSYITGKRPRNSSIGLLHWHILEAEDRDDMIKRTMTPKKEA